MKLNRSLLGLILSVLLSTLLIPMVSTTSISAQTQDSRVALQRGFRTGYSDGYMSGYRDTIDSVAKNYSRHAEYVKADRAFNKDYGTIEDYRDGYQQGFESGYDTGFEKRSFEANLPADLKKRGILVNDSQMASNAKPSDNTPVQDTPVQTVGTTTTEIAKTEQQETPKIEQQAASASDSYRATRPPTILIPRDTELILELQDDLNTEQSREGDRFTAKITAPSELAGATIEGRVSKVRHPGRIRRRSELVLSFDRIILTDNRWSNFSAMLTEVIPVKGDNVKRVDVEGTAIGASSLKSDAVKVGGATGAGLVVGGVVGGPVGAAVGAGVGAAFGVGAVVIERGKHIRLNRNQQLRVKTAYETQIR